MSSDFFDEEFNKQQQQNTFQQRAQNTDTKYYPEPPQLGKDKTKKVVISVVVALLLVLSFVLGMVTQKTTILDTVMSEIKKNSFYYDKELWAQQNIEEAMMVNAGTSMLQTIDDYGFLLSPKEMYELENPTTGTDPTFGVSFLNTNVGYYVRHIAYGSGAFVSGLKVGDMVLRIQREGYTDVDVRSATQEQITNILKGDYNTTVKFTAVRGLDTAYLGDDLSIQTFTLTKTRYEDNFVDYYFGANNTDITDARLLSKLNLSLLDSSNVGYIKLNSFDFTTLVDGNGNQTFTSSGEQFATAMQKFKQAYNGNGKLILDLIGNPGGYVSEALQIAAYLIYDFNQPQRTDYVVTTLKGRTYSNDYSVTIHSDGSNAFGSYFNTTAAATKKQIIILTDKNSASASELLLGCMEDYGTCVHVGETTYGKGIAQTSSTLSQKGTFEYTNAYGQTQTMTYNYGIYLTTAKFYTPKGTNKHGVGFTPTESNTVDTTDYLALISHAKELLS